MLNNFFFTNVRKKVKCYFHSFRLKNKFEKENVAGANKFTIAVGGLVTVL